MYKKQILIIGDSITEGFDVKRHLSSYDIMNLGVSGDSTVEVLQRISAGWFTNHPAIAFLCIGTNDLARERDEYFVMRNVTCIVNRIKSLSPGIKIILSPVFPTRDNPPRPNELIRKLNNLLESLSGQNGVSFFNIFDAFLDAEGQLKCEYTQDGLHLTDAAYSKWAALISEYIDKELAD